MHPNENEDKLKCITPECGKDRKWKGLCPSCYGQAKRLIEQGKTTWDELFDLKLCILDNKPFLIAFNKVKNNGTNLL
jgi:hypothetical protein